MVTKTFDFRGTEGKTTEQGCRPTSNMCGSSGQDAINAANNWCGSNPKVSVTYDKAAINGIRIGSNKSLVGVGSAGVLRGKGLRLQGVKNVIIQNIHITDLNPQYIWGGDAITLINTDNVWIDHCKISLIGRQMLVTGYETAGRVTISNTEFDGKTSWSATCNGKHYWTMLFYGASDKITLMNNWIHDVSGRAPKVAGEGNVVMHAVNNLFENVGGHDFDIGKGGNVLIEGNVFKSVSQPITSASSNAGGTIFNSPSGSEASCSSLLGRSCVVNQLSGSGAFNEYASTSVINAVKAAGKVFAAKGISSVSSSNAGIGRISRAKILMRDVFQR